MFWIKGDADLWTEQDAREEYGEECINAVLDGEQEVDFEGNELYVVHDWEEDQSWVEEG
jgi:hypothetical protein